MDKQCGLSNLDGFLKHLEESGIPLYVDGKSATASQIMQKCVKEDSGYMADYVLDKNGNMEALYYDRIVIQ